VNNIVATILQIILIATIALLVALLPLSNSNVLINGIQTAKSFSFFNPGPYAGYLCALLPVAVGLYWMHENFKFQVPSFRFRFNLLNQQLGTFNLKPETITRAAILSILVFGFFAYPSEILPIKIVATICIAFLAGMAMPLLKGEEISFVLFVKKPSWPLWFKNIPWLKLPITLATVFAIILLLPQVNKLHQAYATWNDAYQLYNYNLYTECLEEYEKALPVLQHNADFMLNYGIALSMVEKHPEALEILKKAKAYQSNSVLYNALGDSYKALEKYKSAEQQYSQAASMSPAKFYPLYLLAKLYDASGQQQKAYEMANTILNKEVKVHSIAIEEIKEEMKQIIEQ
jgi:O-antigen polymerase